MSLSAPVRIPVELRRAGQPLRWFRLASAVSPEGLLFPHALPPELTGPLDVRFFLPSLDLPLIDLAVDPERELALEGRATEVAPAAPAPGDQRERGAEVRAIRFHKPDEPTRLRLSRWVEARLLP